MPRNGDSKKSKRRRKTFGNLFDEEEEKDKGIIINLGKPVLSIPQSFGKRGSTEIAKLKEEFADFFKTHKVQDIIAAIGNADPDSIKRHILKLLGNSS